MRKIAYIFLFQIICFAAFSQNPRWNGVGTQIPARADLDVRWETPQFFVGSNVPTNQWRPKMWIYQLVPRQFSPRAISNLMRMCSFAEHDKVQQDTNGIVFKSPDGLRTLSISFSSGSINYDVPEPHYSPTNLAEGIPKMKDMPELTKNFLREVGINLSEIRKGTNGAPRFSFWEPFTEYFVKPTFITNVEFRAVVFRRSVDGAEVVGNAGHCELHFGEHGKISKIDLSWPDLKRYKSAPTLETQAIIQSLRQGKARQGPIPDNASGIDWRTVKSVTIKQAWPCYYAGNTDFLYPYLTLWTIVETPYENVEVGIDCPIIDEHKIK